MVAAACNLLVQVLQTFFIVNHHFVSYGSLVEMPLITVGNLNIYPVLNNHKH